MSHIYIHARIYNIWHIFVRVCIHIHTRGHIFKCIIYSYTYAQYIGKPAMGHLDLGPRGQNPSLQRCEFEALLHSRLLVPLPQNVAKPSIGADFVPSFGLGCLAGVQEPGCKDCLVGVPVRARDPSIHPSIHPSVHKFLHRFIDTYIHNIHTHTRARARARTHTHTGATARGARARCAGGHNGPGPIACTHE